MNAADGCIHGENRKLNQEKNNQLQGANGSSQLEKEISTTDSVSNSNEHYYGLVNVRVSSLKN